MTSRRTFIKSLAAGGAALGAPEILFAASQTSAQSKEQSTVAETGYNADDETVTINIGNIKIKGRLSFTSRKVKWAVCASRDAVTDRLSIVDPKGDVQGYVRAAVQGSFADIIFYHRSAQNFVGRMTFEGVVLVSGDSFCCRSKAEDGGRVFNLTSGNVANSLDDSIFCVDSDTLLALGASQLSIIPIKKGEYSLSMSGRINKPSEAVFSFHLSEHYFRDRWVPYYKPLSEKGVHKVPTGWMSWNTYFDKATAKDNLQEARIGQKYLQPYGCEIWHIESWQGNSDKLPVCDFYNMNLEVNEKQFPKGMKNLSDEIRSLGFKPGIWMAPFGTGNEEFYRQHKDWFLHDSKGKAISCWNGKYTLDPTNREALGHIEKIFRTASQDWGYEYFKVDGMSGRSRSYCAHLYERPEIRARFCNPSCNDPFEEVVKAIRRGIGEEKYMLACQGHATGPESSYANASRLGADIVIPNQPVIWTGVLNQARCFLNQAFTHNITMICDPDTLLVRDLPTEEARVSATVIALGGQLTFFGDKLAGLPDKKMQILQQTLPVTNVRPKFLYPCFDMREVWNLSMDNGFLPNYNTVALFNWGDEEKTISTTCEELGLPEADYDGWEFWTSTYMPFAKGKEISALVPAHGVRVISLHKAPQIPQWIGSDRHISCNAVEISQYRWDDYRLRMKVHVIAGRAITLAFKIPQGYKMRTLNCPGAKPTAKQRDNVMELTLSCKNTGDLDLFIQFD